MDDIRYHAATLHTFEATAPDGPIRAALSSDRPIDVPGGREILSHAAEAIDWGNAQSNGLPLTIGHSERDPFSQNLPIGRVQNFAVDKGVLRGDLAFDSDEQSSAARGKVERGVARDISITFRVLDAEQTGEALTTITRWRPMAASLVTLPADASVGVGRALELATNEGSAMETTTETGSTEGPTVIERVQNRATASFQRGRQDARTDAAEIVSRAATLRQSRPDIAAEIDDLVTATLEDDAATVSRFNELALDLVTTRAEPAARPGQPVGEVRSPDLSSRNPVISMGETEVQKKLTGLENAILARAVPGAVKQEDLQGNPYKGASLLDASRMHLEFAGTKTFGMTNEQIAKAALRMGRDPNTGSRYTMGAAQYVTADFPAMTENIGFKAMFDGFSRAPRTWDMFADAGSAPDFKAFSVPRLSHTQQLAVVAENAQYQNLTRSDAKESGTLTKKGGLVSYSWESTVNNDINGFTDQLNSSGEAAQATLDTDVWATFTLNQGVTVGGPVMGDTNQLFDSTNHSNYGTAALDLDGIVAARVLMGRQTDDNTNPQAIAPRLSYVAVPLELEDAALNLANSEFLVDSGGAAQRANTVRNTFEVVATHHLTDVTDWFALARKGQTVRVFFLNGEQSPQLEQAQSWDYDAISYKVRFVYIPVWRDWRGAVWMEVAG